MGRLALALIVLAGLPACAFAADLLNVEREGPARQIVELELGGSGWSRLKEGSRMLDHQSQFNEAASFIRRKRMGAGPFFWGWGAQQEVFSFKHREGFPISHFQDYAAQFSIEYIPGAKTLASLVVRPGFYFEDTPTLRAWDIPFDFITGVPIKDPVNGVIGISHGRFYRRPIPVLGLAWALNPKVEIDAVFPEPSINLILADGTEARLGGKLLGAGFRCDSQPGHQSVEYFIYRIGPSITRRVAPGLKLTAGAGYEMQSTFDFSGGRRLRAGDAPYLELGLQFVR